MSILSGKKVIIIGDRDGIRVPRLKNARRVRAQK